MTSRPASAPATTAFAPRAVLITGANSGLGFALARLFATRGATVLMVGRDPRRLAVARQAILDLTGNPRLHPLVANLAEQRAILRLVAQVLGRVDRLDLLINNAGSAFPERRLSADGIEMALAVNHLAPYLLTRGLLAAAALAPHARVINIGTRMDTAMRFDDLNWERRRYRMMAAYGQSKLGNIHFTRELARRLESDGPGVYCIFPGVFNSNLGGTDGAQNWFWRAIARLLGWALPHPEQAARRVTHLLADALAVRGGYYGDRRLLPVPAQAADADANRTLWRLSAELTGLPAD